MIFKYTLIGISTSCWL